MAVYIVDSSVSGTSVDLSFTEVRVIPSTQVIICSPVHTGYLSLGRVIYISVNLVVIIGHCVFFQVLSFSDQIHQILPLPLATLATNQNSTPKPLLHSCIRS